MKTYILKVSLDVKNSPLMGEGKINQIILANKKAPYLEVEVAESQSLYKLAEMIIVGFGFNFDHCFGFFDKINDMWASEKRYELFVDIGEACEPETKSVKKTKVSEIWQKPGDKMLFFFDYGAGWHFIVELINLGEKELKVKNPIIIKKEGQFPEQYPECEE